MSAPSGPLGLHARPTALALALAAASLAAHAAEPLSPAGAMVRQGEWGGDVGTYLIPAPFENKPARQWPMADWVVLMIDDAAGTLTVRPLAENEARQRLAPIVQQVTRAAEQPGPSELKEVSAEEAADLFVRTPGVAWQAGSVPLHRFKNGTPTLQPELGYRFQMALNGQPYAFTVQNGFRTADGRPYGSGVQFTLEIDGQRYEYDLGGYGWEVSIRALGDFDHDGKPDFLFYIGGGNSSNEALVLSSMAKPGKNPPSAYLTAVGC